MKTTSLFQAISWVAVAGLLLLSAPAWAENPEACDALLNDKSVPTPPKDPVGFKLLNAQRYDEAADYFSKSLEKDAKDIDACRGLGLALCYLGNIADGVAKLSECIALAPERVEIYMSRGLCYRMKMPPDLNAAEADFKKALELKPDLGYTHHHLGLIYMAKGELDNAATEFRAAIKINPKHYSSYEALARCLLSLGRYEEAISVIQAAISEKPVQPIQFYNLLGIAFFKLGRYGEAEAAFLLESSIHPQFIDPYVNLANLYVDKCDLPQALDAYRRILAIQPNNSLALANVGAIHVFDEKYQQAIPQLKRAIAINPTDHIAHHYLARAYEGLGDQENAAAEHKKAIELGYVDSDSPFRINACKKPSSAPTDVTPSQK